MNYKKLFNKSIPFIYIIVLLIMLEGFGMRNGLLGFLLFFIVIFGFRIYFRREDVLLGMKTMESKIFGKPLDRDAWEKGELKKKKIRLKW